MAGRVVAGAQADDRKQREAPVGGGLAQLDAKLLGQHGGTAGRQPMIQQLTLSQN